VQTEQAERIERAWAELASIPRLEPRQIIVRSRSMLGREGWVAVLFVGGRLAVAVPEHALVARVEDALSEVPLIGMTAEAVISALPSVEVLGPAALFYLPGTGKLEQEPNVVRAARAELDAFRRALSELDLDESGLRDVDSDVFAVRDDTSAPVAMCGYRRWPAHIAHVCIGTAPDHRRLGAGRRVARAAIADAIGNGLLPQWRAKPDPSKALARSLGLEEWGFQMSLRLAD
jgi:hypothetical protein